MKDKSIFDILEENTNWRSDFVRINKLVSTYNAVLVQPRSEYHLKEFVDTYCFSDWKGRKHCIDVDDFFDSIGFKNILISAKNGDVKSYLLFIETIYNLWKLTIDYVSNNQETLLDEPLFQYYDTMDMIKQIMDDSLAEFNQTAYYDDDSEQVIVSASDATVFSVAESVEVPIRIAILRYNSERLKGNVEEKKSLLLRIAQDFDGSKKNDLNKCDSNLKSNIFFILNEFNLRHNNIDPQDPKHYHGDVAAMTPEEIEKWYDDLYRLFLFAYQSLENEEINDKVKTMRQKFKSSAAT